MKGNLGSNNHRKNSGSKNPLNRNMDVNPHWIRKACERDIELCKGSSNCRGLAQLIAEALRVWVRVNHVYCALSDPRQRKKLLAAIELVQKTAAGLHPLILGDGRFSVSGHFYLAEFVRGLWLEEGGRHHELPAAC